MILIQLASRADLVLLAEEQAACDCVKDVGADVAAAARFCLPGQGARGDKQSVGIQVLQLQAPVSQHLCTSGT